jgi:ADP-ribosylglycohydrolase
MTEHKNIARATLFGVAFGDALGKPLEFIASRKQIINSGLGFELPLPMGVVTDDTEMTLAVARAIENFQSMYAPDDPNGLAWELRHAYMDWQDANVWGRAAGGTCLRATSRLRKLDRDWENCTEPLSKGCGANMRVAPIGLIPEWNAEEVADVAQLSSALTHGHPVALAAAELTALGVYYLRTGECTLDNLNEQLLWRAYDQRGKYREHVLGHLVDHWRGPRSRKTRKHALTNTAERAMTFGWNACIDVLKNVKRALRAKDQGGDVSQLCGAGWIAEDALATSVYAASRWSEYPRIALARAVRTTGDSDSLGAITGSFLGAALGEDAFPAYWYERIEYADELNYFGQLWDAKLALV